MHLFHKYRDVREHRLLPCVNVEQQTLYNEQGWMSKAISGHQRWRLFLIGSGPLGAGARFDYRLRCGFGVNVVKGTTVKGTSPMFRCHV